MAALMEQLQAMPLSPTVSTPPGPVGAASPFRLEHNWLELVACADAGEGGGGDGGADALVRSMSRRERARQEALWELIATEQLIIRNLRLVNDVRRVPFRSVPFLPPAATATQRRLCPVAIPNARLTRARAVCYNWPARSRAPAAP